MRYEDAAAFRQALEDRLRRRGAGVGARVARDRKRVVFDRFLARLTAVAPDRWLLKGGFALELRLVDQARTTKDIDLVWRDGHDDVLDVLLDAVDYDAGDFFVFTVDRAGEPDDRLGGSRRFRISAALAGRLFDGFVLDVGMGAGRLGEVEQLKTPDLLSFAELQPVTVLVVPLETQLAEKLHAYTRTYVGGRVSTRVKDLVDMVLIAECFTLDAAALQRGINSTFAARGTHPVPAALPAPPPEWRKPFAVLAHELDIPADLRIGHGIAAAFLDPVLSGVVKTGAWDTRIQSWQPR